MATTQHHPESMGFLPTNLDIFKTFIVFPVCVLYLVLHLVIDWIILAKL